MAILSLFFGEQPEGTESPVASAILVSVVSLVLGVYLVRGEGPTDKAIKQRGELSGQSANSAVAAAAVSGQTVVNVNMPTDNSAVAAQINAIANPDTAKALQNLQKLLYTRTISDTEFQAAKNKLLGDLPK
ncbi:MAG: hypothetical protein ABI394_12505 [Mycobacterium sp.]